MIGYVSVVESGTMQDEADAAANKMKRKASKQVLLLPLLLPLLLSPLLLLSIDHIMFSRLLSS